MMKNLLTATAAMEGVAGMALAAWPPMPAALLLGTSLDTPAALTVARLAGAALLALGVACWLARDDAASRRRSEPRGEGTRRGHVGVQHRSRRFASGCRPRPRSQWDRSVASSCSARCHGDLVRVVPSRAVDTVR
jgi:hypothetical protein